ncbi:MAG: glycosyltransferase [Chloroflexota bacterium]
MPPSPIDLLAVASWYPSRLDPIAGRFVADQLEALAATGRVRPAVVSFEPADLVGAGALRSRTAAIVRELAATAIREQPALFLAPPAGGWSGGGDGRSTGSTVVPVSRLTIPSGRNPAAGALHGAIARDGALHALADRFESGRETDIRRPELIHGHTVYPDGAAAATLAARLGVPLVVTEHASFVARLIAEPAIRARYEATVEAASRLIVVSDILAGELIDALPGIASKITVIPNAIPVGAFPLVARADRMPDELVFVGYRKATKGIETLLRAFAIVHGRRPNATLRLIGSSPTQDVEASWERLATSLGVAGAVRFETSAGRAGVNAALARASVFVHPSPRETFGVVAVEALATGLPVVAADSGGVTEILGSQPDALGAVVEVNDPEALAAGVLRVLERIDSFDPARLRAAVLGRFDEQTVGRRLLELYAEVLAVRDGSAEATRGPGVRGSAVRVPADSGPVARTAGPAARRVLVAIDPGRAALVARLGDVARSRIVLVTSTGVDSTALSGLVGSIETDLHGRLRALADAASLGPPTTGIRRLVRAARHPLAVARRRGWLPGLEQLISGRGSDAIRSAVALASQGNPGPVELVCIDGLDHLAAAPLIRDGTARLGHGGLRRLGDEG